MAVIKGKYRVKNSQNEYDIVYLETIASQVKFEDGKTFQEKLDEGSLKGKDGLDGLTTSVTVGSTTYSHVDGNITLPSYPSTPESVGAEPANSNIQAHILSLHAPSDAQKNSDITKAEIEAKLTGEITTHTHNYETSTGSQDKANKALAEAKKYTDIELTKKSNVDHTHPYKAEDWIPKWEDVADKPTSLPANGGNADTVDGKHASDFAEFGHTHSYSELNDLPNIPSKVSELQNDLGFITNSDVHKHENKEVLDSITQEKINYWNNKSEFSGAYEDLTGLPEIPVVDVDKAYVDEELNKKANSESVYTKEEVNTLVENTTSIDDNEISPDSTWSSFKINKELTEKLEETSSNNLAYDKLVLGEDWVQEDDGNFYFDISHNLGTDRVFVSAVDNLSKEAVLIGYKIIDKNNIKISSTSQIEVFVVIVNGDNQIQISQESDTRKNIAFDKEVSIDDWTMEDGLATVVVSHSLFTDRVLVSAISIDTKESLKIAYKIIDNTRVKVSILNPVNAIISVLNGQKEFIHLIKEGSEIEDSVTSSVATWSSKKIQEEISKITISWDDIVGKPTEFTPISHNHNNIYYQKNEIDVIVEPIEDTFIDGLFTSPAVKINGVKYYTAEEIDAKLEMLVSMIENLSK